MNKKRPVNLDLTTFHYPPMAIVSILHRISGVVLFMFLPFLLYLLGQSLSSPLQFAQVLAPGWPVKGLIWVYLAALSYHCIAGFRHLIMDLGFGDTPSQGRCSAYIVLVLFVIVAVFLGVSLW